MKEETAPTQTTPAQPPFPGASLADIRTYLENSGEPYFIAIDKLSAGQQIRLQMDMAIRQIAHMMKTDPTLVLGTMILDLIGKQLETSVDALVRAKAYAEIRNERDRAYRDGTRMH